MTNMKITKLSDYNNSTLSVSSKQAIQELQKFQKENPVFDKVILIAVNNRGGEFCCSWWKGRMLCSEAITALHLALDDQIRILNGEDV